MSSTIKAVLENIMSTHKKNSKLRIDVELSSGNVLERVAVSEIIGEVLTLIMAEEKYYYNLNHVIGFSSSYDDHQ